MEEPKTIHSKEHAKDPRIKEKRMTKNKDRRNWKRQQEPKTARTTNSLQYLTPQFAGLIWFHTPEGVKINNNSFLAENYAKI